MAVFNGTSVKNSGGNTGSIHAETWVSYPNSTHARVRIRVWWSSTYSTYSSSNSRSFSGTHFPGASGSVSISHGGSGGSTTLYDQTVDVARGYGTGPSGSFSASISGIANFSGTTFSVSGSWSAQALPYSAPAAPTSLTATRVSDTHQSLAFSSTSTTGAPRTSFTLQRAAYGGDWVTIASPTSSPYADKTTTANRRYDYRVRANGPGGSSAWYRPNSGVGDVSTTPAAPTSVTAAKDSAGDVTVTWAGTWPYPTGWLVFDIDESTDGQVTWTRLATGLALATRSWKHVSPDVAKTHVYSVQARAIGPNLPGGWRASNTVQLLAPPNAPKPTGPNTAVDATSQISLTWAHSPVDSTPQRLYEVRYRVDGGEWETTGEAASAITSHVVPANTWENGQAVEWQVRTWGLHADASPWSSTATLTLSAAPTVVISTPGDGSAWGSPTLTVAWAYYQQQGSAQAQANIEVLDPDDEQVLDSRTVNGTTSSVTMAQSLPDGVTRLVRVRVRSGVGLWSDWDQVTISVSYLRPTEPTVALTWRPQDGAVLVQVTNPQDPWGEAPTPMKNDLYRSIDGGPWVLIAEGIARNGSFVDPLPSLNGVNSYRAVAWSSLPSMEVGPYESITTRGPFQDCEDTSSIGPLVHTEGAFVNGGAGYGQVARAYYDVDITESDVGVEERVLYRFSGMTYPEEFSSDALMEEVQVTFTARAHEKTIRGVNAATIPEWRAMCNLVGPHYYRDHYGNRFCASLSPLSVARRGPVGDLKLAATRAAEEVITAIFWEKDHRRYLVERDTDHEPYVGAEADMAQIGYDDDAVPYVTTPIGDQISIDTDGVPYLNQGV